MGYGATQQAHDVADIVVACQAGDFGHLDELIATFDPVMRRVARKYVRNSHDVDDAVQDAWTSFMLYVGTIREPHAVAKWLAVTVSRTALAICRRQAKVVVSGFDVPLPSDDLERELSTLPIAMAPVNDAVARLSDADRELLRLLFDEELSYSTISSLTGRAIGGIGPTRKRLLERLERDDAIQGLRDCA